MCWADAVRFRLRTAHADACGGPDGRASAAAPERERGSDEPKRESEPETVPPATGELDSHG